MASLKEGDLEIGLPAGVEGRRFDGRDHGLSHCMKAVDFIVDLDDRTLFVELKDPGAQAVPVDRRKDFVDRFTGGELDRDLALKYRDSFLYEWAAERVAKPVHYLVLVGIENLDAAMLQVRTDALQRTLPLSGPEGGAWKRAIVDSCLVLNVEAWNRHLKNFPVTRANADV